MMLRKCCDDVEVGREGVNCTFQMFMGTPQSDER